MDTEEIKELVKSRAWSEDNARVSVRAEHKCEYCGLDFFASVSNYCLWQKDHIVPIKHGDTDEMSNYAAVSSTRRRNGLAQLSGWRLEAQGLTRSFVETSGDLVQECLRMAG